MKIIGQSLALRYLTKGLEQNRLPPSLLFVGPSGAGRKTCAVELAKYFACQQKPPAADDTLLCCDTCPSCQRIQENNHSDLLIVDRLSQAVILREKPETQTAIKIESIRYLDKFLRLRPVESERRVVIVDEAERMTPDAANALLKILEEPPPQTQIVLIAPDERAVLSTIRSRCAVVRFRPLPSDGAVPGEPFDIADYELDEFFELISNTNWRKEGRKHAEQAVMRILESFQKKWREGDTSQLPYIKATLAARRQIDRNVSPRLVLENLYLEIFPQ